MKKYIQTLLPFPQFTFTILLLLTPFLVSGNMQESAVSNASVATAPPTIPAAVDSAYLQDYIRKTEEFRHHLPLVKQFYKDRNYAFAWFKEGKLIPQAAKLMQAIDKAKKQGLNPSAYQVKNLDEMHQTLQMTSLPPNQQQQKQQELDLALTASYFNYASDFYMGAVDPHSAEAIEWEVKENRIKLNKALETILEERQGARSFYEFEAVHEGYRKLQEALVQYRQLQERGGWPTVEAKGVVRLNDTAKVVLDVRRRLFPQQQVNEQDSALYIYDKRMQQAVSTFQRRHGLVVDGILGPQTYKAMNVSVGERIDQLVLNMERWRWLPKQLAPEGKSDTYILVNIPAYQVSVMEKDKEVMQMKAVVGENLHSTPIFSHEIQYLIFSPYWNVPNRIVEQDIKPHMQRNQNWLSTNHMEMVTTFGPDAKRVPVSRVNWNTLTRHNFDYRIRQRPGPWNALGRVKFMFPNEYAVYLHDTPADHLFNEAARNLSHGCVRLERPADLATYLLRNKTGWDKNRVVQAMNARKEQRVDLENNVPVYLVYFTAWVADDGTVHFRNDIYDHDQTLAQELF